MIYVYRRPQSDSANTLAEALEACRIRKTRAFTNDDTIVCWGEHLTGVPGKILNGSQPLRSKYTDITLLHDANVPTVDASLTRPRTGEWLARTSDHERGSDLLNQNASRADYWVKKLNITKEFRVHIFKGLSIRAGEKVKARADAHPWIRSWDAGWDIKYNGVTDRERKIAKDACKALKLDFGAVDLGLTDTGKLIVLEVNRAPALDEGNTAKVYANYINEWRTGAR